MSSQPNQSLIDGIRCLQYLVSSGKAVGCRELARQLEMNATRVNRLLLTMASIGLTIQDEQRRYLPGPNIHALAAQAIRGSSLFSSALPVLELHAPKDIIVAMGVLWEQQVIYIYHSKPGSLAYQALAGFHTLQAHESVIGMALLAGRDDAMLRAQYSNEILATIAPYLTQQREQQRVIWHHEDGEVSIAMPLGKNQAALAFAGIYDTTPEQIVQRELQLGKLVNNISDCS